MDRKQERALRAEKRRELATINVEKLHSKTHNSFHCHLDLKDSWELLAKLSKERWIEETGEKPPLRVDKSQYRVISLEQRYS